MTENDNRGWKPTDVSKNPDGTIRVTSRVPTERSETRVHAYGDRTVVYGTASDDPEVERRRRVDMQAEKARKKGIPHPTHAARTHDEMGLDD